MRRSALGSQTVVFCLLLACVMLGVSIFVPHDCCGDGCSVCLTISAARALFLEAGFVCAILLLRGVQPLRDATNVCRACFAALTPVTLRVVMRD